MYTFLLRTKSYYTTQQLITEQILLNNFTNFLAALFHKNEKNKMQCNESKSVLKKKKPKYLARDRNRTQSLSLDIVINERGA